MPESLNNDDAHTASTSPENVVLRPAVPADAEPVARLITSLVAGSSLLPVPADKVRTRIDTYTVAEIDGEIAGCVAMRDYDDGLVEVRSLAVAKKHSNLGIGSKLVQEAMRRWKDKNAKIFALTSRTSFFERLGFHLVDKSLFPQKIWRDCDSCPKKDRCDEVAVLHGTKD